MRKRKTKTKTNTKTKVAEEATATAGTMTAKVNGKTTKKNPRTEATTMARSAAKHTTTQTRQPRHNKAGKPR
jgi:hypothetical protein